MQLHNMIACVVHALILSNDGGDPTHIYFGEKHGTAVVVAVTVRVPKTVRTRCGEIESVAVASAASHLEAKVHTHASSLQLLLPSW